jgi:hypothetical protein
MVGYERVIGLLELPVATFQKPLNQAALIIEAGRQHYPVVLQILFKPVILGLLLRGESGTDMKDQPLTLPLALHHHILSLRCEVEGLLM